MTDIINIECGGDSSSKIVIGPVEKHLKTLIGPDRRVVVVTDANVHRSFRELVDSYDHIIIGQGETSKTFATVAEVMRQLLQMGADRSTFLLGMGGGIVTDITGFTASTYMRGMDFGFIATTLLGQVDGSIGGKNGLNIDGYKNIAGTFNQPRFVICDPAALRSLPEREFRAGLAEVIKAGVIADPELFGLLEKHTFEEIRDEGELLTRIISHAARVKTDIVSRDEYDRGERRKLNLGHTLAHAMEKSMPLFSHGEAVAAGLVMVADASVRLGKLSAAEAQRIRNTVIKMGLPAEYPIETKKLLSAVKYDKKRENDTIHLVLPVSIGNCEIEGMSFTEVENLFLTE